MHIELRVRSHYKTHLSKCMLSQISFVIRLMDEKVGGGRLYCRLHIVLLVLDSASNTGKIIGFPCK